MANCKKDKVEAHKNNRCIFRPRLFYYFTRPLITIEVFKKCDILSFSYHFFSQNEINVEIYSSPYYIQSIGN